MGAEPPRSKPGGKSEFPKSGKSGRRSKRKERDRMSDGPQASERGTLSAVHTPRHIARFRKSGKRRFPDFRREADALQKRWEAKRSR